MKKIILDVREPYEFKSGHVEGALNIPLGKLASPDQLAKLDKDAQIILYCASGNRSGMALKLLESQGYTHLINCINKQQTENYLSTR